MFLSFFQLSLGIRNVWPQRMSLKAFILLYILLLLAGMPVTLLACIPYGLFGILVAVCIYGLVICRDTASQNVCMGMIGSVLTVSGLIIAAKNDAAHQALSAQLQDHTLARTYEAVVTGNLREDRGTVDAPIGRHHTDRKRMAVTDRGGKRAVTHWEVIERFPGLTYVRCRLETGRTHQIRVHMAHMGHPVYGDTVYGAKKPVPGLTGQCLHAAGLRFVHPRTGETVEATCPLNEEFQVLLRKLRGG